MEIRRATPSDYAVICELARANHKDNLSVEDQRQGFLSARFSVQQISEIAGDLGIFIASDEGRVAGFVCVSRTAWPGQPAIVKHMLDVLSRSRLHDKTLEPENVFIYGPVCIDVGYRGRGLLRKLYQYLQEEMVGLYATGVAIVAEDNEPSLKAHIAGLKMLQIGNFLYEHRSYRILAFDIRTAT